MLKAIVGIEIPLRRLQGKWKMSQNRVERDRAGVITALNAQVDAASHEMARLVSGERKT
jgi:transcriptional regulator